MPVGRKRPSLAPKVYNESREGTLGSVQGACLER